MASTLSCGSRGGGSLCRHDREVDVLGFVARGRDAQYQGGDDREVLEIEFAVSFGVHPFQQYVFLLFCLRVHRDLENDGCGLADRLTERVRDLPKCAADAGGRLAGCAALCSWSTLCAGFALAAWGLCKAAEREEKG